MGIGVCKAFRKICFLVLAFPLWATTQPAIGAPARFDFYAAGSNIVASCDKREDPDNSGCDIRLYASSNQVVLQAAAWADGSGWFIFCCWNGEVSYSFSASIPYAVARQGFIDFSSPTPQATFPVVAVSFDVSYSSYVGISPNPLEELSGATAGPVTVGGTGLTATTFSSIYDKCHGGSGSNDDIDMECVWGGSRLYEPPTATLVATTWGKPAVGDVLRFNLEICESLPPDLRWDCAPGESIAIEQLTGSNDLPVITIDGNLSAGSFGRGFGDNGGEALACLGLGSSALGWVDCDSHPLLITASVTSIGSFSVPLRSIGDSYYQVLAEEESSPIPEPSSLALSYLGLAGLVLARRRKH